MFDNYCDNYNYYHNYLCNETLHCEINSTPININTHPAIPLLSILALKKIIDNSNVIKQVHEMILTLYPIFLDIENE